MRKDDGGSASSDSSFQLAVLLFIPMKQVDLYYYGVGVIISGHTISCSRIMQVPVAPCDLELQQ